MNHIAGILEAATERDPHSAEHLLPLTYKELRRSATRQLAGQPAGQTLQATALVHEAFLRLIGDPARTWQDRRHFFASAAEAMRHILVDRARRRAALRHGGTQTRVDLDQIQVAAQTDGEHITRLNDALERLAGVDAEAAELVRLRFFGGLTFGQAAEIMGVSERTAKRTWAYARAWLFDEMNRPAGRPA
jgi:RNA polymerase sigma factor (TIGR02999 family)